MPEKERLLREMIAMRVAAELPAGAYVKLGIGMPNLVAEFTPPEKESIFHAENGILGFGRSQQVTEHIPDLANAGGQPVTFIPGSCLMDSAPAFALAPRRPLAAA